MPRPFLILWAVFLCPSTIEAADRLNIVVLLADDMGCSDIAPF